METGDRGRGDPRPEEKDKRMMFGTMYPGRAETHRKEATTDGLASRKKEKGSGFPPPLGGEMASRLTKKMENDDNPGVVTPPKAPVYGTKWLMRLKREPHRYNLS